jgi:SAM-dependent methyltransferase
MDKHMEEVPCEICGSRETFLLFESRDTKYPDTPRDLFGIVRCRRCGLIYLSPRPDEQEIGRFYPEAFYGWMKGLPQERTTSTIRTAIRALVERHEKSIRDAIVKEKVERLKSASSGSGRLLEIGCAGGKVLKKMRDMGWEVVGIDISAEMADHARENYGVTVLVGELSDHDLEPESFDAISLWATLPHLPHPGETLKRVVSLLKPNGVLVVSCSNADSLEWKLMPWNKEPFDIPRHLYHFSPQTLSALAQKAGLEPIKVSHHTRTAYSMSHAFIRKLFDRVSRICPGELRRVVEVAGIPVAEISEAIVSGCCALFCRGHTFVMVLAKASNAGGSAARRDPLPFD